MSTYVDQSIILAFSSFVNPFLCSSVKASLVKGGGTALAVTEGFKKAGTGCPVPARFLAAAAVVVAATAVAAAVTAKQTIAVAIAAAAEQQDENDNPPAVIVVTHKI